MCFFQSSLRLSAFRVSASNAEQRRATPSNAEQRQVSASIDSIRLMQSAGLRDSHGMVIRIMRLTHKTRDTIWPALTFVAPY